MKNHKAVQPEAHPCAKPLNGFATLCPLAAQTFLPALPMRLSLQAASLLGLSHAAQSPDVRRAVQPQNTIKIPRTFGRRGAD